MLQRKNLPGASRRFSSSPIRAGRHAVVGLAACALLAACSGSGDGEQNGQDGNSAAPTTVGVVTVKPTSVAMTTELSGRTEAYETSEVRPQVSGVIRKREFTQGAIVHAGQTLYQIDASPYEASAQQARANLQSAQADAQAAKIKADRYKPLAAQQAISQQDYTDAQSQAQQAAASVAQAKAQVRTANINLRYTTVPAPITGRIGRSYVTVGALVTQNQTDSLATIQRLDPIYVDIKQSSSEILALRRALSKGDTVPSTAKVRLTLEDGEDYGRVGTIDFSEPMVDENTGTITLRATFPNPEGLLLPGMFVRAHLSQSIDRDAFLVPQQALNRDAKGNASVLVVGKGNKAESRPVKTARTKGAYWVVTSGLHSGDKIIVQGTSKIKPGAPVHPVSADKPEVLTSGGGNSQDSQDGQE